MNKQIKKNKKGCCIYTERSCNMILGEMGTIASPMCTCV